MDQNSQNIVLMNNSRTTWPTYMLMLSSEFLGQFTIRPKKKRSCLVVLHRPPLMKNWKKVFTVQKYTAPNFQNSKKVGFFFVFLEFSGFKFTVLKFL